MEEVKPKIHRDDLRRSKQPLIQVSSVRMRSCREIYNFIDIGASPVIRFSGVVILFSSLIFTESNYLTTASCTRHTLGVYDIFFFSFMFTQVIVPSLSYTWTLVWSEFIHNERTIDVIHHPGTGEAFGVSFYAVNAKGLTSTEKN